MKIVKIILTSAAITVAATHPGDAMAQAVTGQVNSQIELTAACEVNGSTGTSNVNFGLIDFGAHTTLFTVATGQARGSGGNGIAVRCSPGADATLTVVSGTHDAASAAAGRAMGNGSQFVPYDLFRDAGYATVLANGATIAVVADGTVKTVPVFARALGANGLTAGTYTDTVSVRLDF